MIGMAHLEKGRLSEAQAELFAARDLNEALPLDSRDASSQTQLCKLSTKNNNKDNNNSILNHGPSGGNDVFADA